MTTSSSDSSDEFVPDQTSESARLTDSTASVHGADRRPASESACDDDYCLWQADIEFPDSLSEAAVRSLVHYDTGLDHNRDDGALAGVPPEQARIVRMLRETFGSLAEEVRDQPPPDQPGGMHPHGDADSGERQMRSLGRFEVRGRIGRGSFGNVWLAWDPQLGREVAIKVPHADIRLDAEVSRRFLREGRAVARLNHQNIVRVLEAGTVDGVPFLATEFVRGESLGDLLRRRQEFSVTAAADLIRQLADATHHAHLHGVLHRDIKPDNILLDTAAIPGVAGPAEMIPRLTDFGLARIPDAGERSTAGLVIGTPDYMAPEQARGDSSSHCPATDVFSLGMVLYEILVGQLPDRTPVRSLRRQRSDIPRDLESICLHCLEADASHRYATAGELRDELGRFLDGRPTVVRPLPVHEQLVRWCRHHPTALTVFLTVTLCLTIVCGVIWDSGKKEAAQNKQLTIALGDVEYAHQLLEQKELRFRELAWATGMKRAFGQFARAEYANVQETLEELRASHPDANRRPEWIIVQRELADRFQILLDSGYPLHDVVPVPGTSKIAFAGQAPHVTLLDLVNATQPVQISVGPGTVHALAISPDARRMAVGKEALNGSMSTPVLLDVESGTIYPSGLAGLSAAESLTFSPDGSQLAVGFRYEKVQIASTGATQTVTPETLVAERRNRSVVWLNSEALVSQLDLHTLEIWTDRAGTEPRRIFRDAGFECFAGSPDGTLIIAATYRRRCDLEVIRAADGQTVMRLAGLGKLCRDVEVSSDGRRVAAGMVDGRLAVWTLPEAVEGTPSSGIAADIAPLAVVHIHDGPVTALCWCGHFVVSAGEDGRVIRSSPVLPDRPVPEPCEDVSAVCFLRNSDDVLVGFRSGTVLAVPASKLPAVGNRDLIAADTSWISDGHVMCQLEDAVSAIAVSADGQHLAVGTNAGLLMILNIHEPSARSVFCPPDKPDRDDLAINAIAFSFDGRRVTWTGNDQHVHSTDLPRPDLAWHQPLPSAGWTLAESPDSRVVAVGGHFEDVRFFAASDGRPVSVTSHTRGLATFVCRYHGERLITGHLDGTIRFRAANGTAGDSVLRLHPAGVRTACLSVNSGFCVSMDAESNTGVWNAVTGDAFGLLPVRPNSDGVAAYWPQVTILSDDERWLVTLKDLGNFKSELRACDLRNALD